MRRILPAMLLMASSLLYAGENASSEQNRANDYKFWEKHDPSWYLGAAAFVGDHLFAESQNASELEIVSNTAVQTIVFNNSRPPIGYQVYLGYNVNPLIAAEFKFLQVVSPCKFSIHQTFTSDPLDFTNQRNYRLRQIAFGPAVLFSIPISQYFTPFFKGGMYAFRYHREYDYVQAHTPPTAATLKATYWNVRFIQGFGIKSQLGDYLGLRLEYECAINPIIDSRVKLIMGNLNLGAYVTF